MADSGVSLDESEPVFTNKIDGHVKELSVANSDCSKHNDGSGDSCEVCSLTSAELIAGAKVGGETDDVTESSNIMPRDEDSISSSMANSSPDTISSSPDARPLLTKYDSGISVRDSLLSVDSKSEDDVGNIPSSSSQPTGSSEGVEADMLDLDDVQPAKSSQDASASSRTEASKNIGTSSSKQPGRESLAHVIDNTSDCSENNTTTRRVRHRRRVHLLSSSNSDSSDSSTTSGPDEPSSDNDDEDDKPEIQVDMSTMPRDPWRVLPELHRRETGFCTQMMADRLFCQRVGASLKFVQRLELQHKLEGHEGCVNALNFNQSGTLLASGSDDLNVVIWNWAEKKPYLVFDSGHRSNVFQCKFMPYSGDTHIVTCARDGYVRLAELSSTGVCKGTKKLAQHRNAAHRLTLLQDSSHVLYSCGEDALVYEIDLRKDKPNKLSITRENNKKVALYSIHANPCRSYEYCVGGHDHFIRIYDKRMINENLDNGVVKKFCPHHLVGQTDIKANVTCAIYNYNGTEVLGTYSDEEIYMFDTSHSDGAEYIHRYAGHRNNSTVKSVNFYGPHSEYIVSGSDCSNVFLWEKESEKIVQYFHADEGGVVNVLEPHPHLPILATSGLDSDVKIWTPTAQQPTVLKGLKTVTRQNERERNSERRRSDPEMVNSQILWLLMEHLHRSENRQDRHDVDDPPSSDSDMEGGSDDSDTAQEPMQCVPQ